MHRVCLQPRVARRLPRGLRCLRSSGAHTVTKASADARARVNNIDEINNDDDDDEDEDEDDEEDDDEDDNACSNACTNPCAHACAHACAEPCASTRAAGRGLQ